MKRVVFPAVLCFFYGGLCAQQPELLGTGASAGGQGKAVPAVEESSAPSKQLPAVKASSAAAAALKSAAAGQAASPVKTAKPAFKPAVGLSTASAEAAAAAIKPAPADKKTPVKAENTLQMERAIDDMNRAQLGVSTAPVDGAGAAGGFAVNKRHLVVQGDTLWDLSGKYYGDPFKWGRIYNANMNTVANPDRIYPKNELEIPDITEEVTPAAAAGPVIGEDVTVTEPDLQSSETLTAHDAQVEEVPAPVAVKKDLKPWRKEEPASPPDEKLADLFKSGDLSEEMPADQKEWGSGVKIVADTWREDGVITAKDGVTDRMADSFSISGETVLVGLSSEGLVKKGDYLNAYMKGTSAYDKNGKRLGYELQRAGILEVISVDGRQVKAKVLDASTSIIKGMLIKKK